MNTYYECELYDPETDTRGYLVIDRLVGGLAGGALRMSPTVTIEEVRNWAEVSTYQHCAMGLPLGGAHAGIVGDPSRPDKQEQLAAFARMAQTLLRSCFLVGEGMVLKANDVRVSADVLSDGLKLEQLQNSLAETGLTEAVGATVQALGFDLAGAAVAVQDFGATGYAMAGVLAAKGARIVAVSDEEGMIYKETGLEVQELHQLRKPNGAIDRTRLSGVELRDGEEILALPVDLLIPAVTAHVIHAENAEQIQAKLIVEAGGHPTTFEADQMLAERGIHVLPDFLAHAGAATGFGLMVLGQAKAEDVVTATAQRIGQTVRAIIAQAHAQGEADRIAALALAAANLQKVIVFA